MIPWWRVRETLRGQQLGRFLVNPLRGEIVAAHDEREGLWTQGGDCGATGAWNGWIAGPTSESFGSDLGGSPQLIGIH